MIRMGRKAVAKLLLKKGAGETQSFDPAIMLSWYIISLLYIKVIFVYRGAFQKSLPALPRLSLKSPHVAEN